MQAAGAAGLAITNDGASPLARGGAARRSRSRPATERAVPATKTVTATLIAFALVAAALGPAPFTREQLERVPEWVAAVLDDPAPAERVAAELEDDDPAARRRPRAAVRRGAGGRAEAQGDDA